MANYERYTMNKIKTQAIHYESKLDLALKICQTAPIGYTGFDLHKPIEKGFVAVTYARGIGGSYLSVEKLAQELGLILLSPREELPLKPYFPSNKTWEAVQQGKRGLVLLR